MSRHKPNRVFTLTHISEPSLSGRMVLVTWVCPEGHERQEMRWADKKQPATRRLYCGACVGYEPEMYGRGSRIPAWTT